MWCAVLVAQTQSINTGPRLCYFLYFFFGFSFRLFFFFFFFFVCLFDCKNEKKFTSRSLVFVLCRYKLYQQKCSNLNVKGAKTKGILCEQIVSQNPIVPNVYILYIQKKREKRPKKGTLPFFSIFLKILIEVARARPSITQQTHHSNC